MEKNIFRYDKLKNKRLKLGIPKNQLAKKIGISDVGYGYIERGIKNPSMKMLAKIANVLNLNPDYFFRP